LKHNDTPFFVVPILPDILSSFRHQTKVDSRIIHGTEKYLETAQLVNFTDLPINMENNASISTPKNEKEGRDMGLLLGSKALVQLVTNMFVGPITNRLKNSMFKNYSVVRLCGFEYSESATRFRCFLALSFWLYQQ